jgi:hypothetical protein
VAGFARLEQAFDARNSSCGAQSQGFIEQQNTVDVGRH